MRGEPLDWSLFPHLEQYWKDWITAKSYPRDFDSMPAEWQDVQVLLCSIEKQLQLEAYVLVSGFLGK